MDITRANISWQTKTMRFKFYSLFPNLCELSDPSAHGALNFETLYVHVTFKSFLPKTL